MKEKIFLCSCFEWNCDKPSFHMWKQRKQRKYRKYKKIQKKTQKIHKKNTENPQKKQPKSRLQNRSLEMPIIEILCWCQPG